jgi:hypothetical protein
MPELISDWAEISAAAGAATSAVETGSPPSPAAVGTSAGVAVSIELAHVADAAAGASTGGAAAVSPGGALTTSTAAIGCAAMALGTAPLVTKSIKLFAKPKTESASQPMSTAMRRHVIRCS